MLKGIDPLLNAELLGHLAAMGHGDVVAIVDRNYPAHSTAQRLVTLSGVGVDAAARAVFSVFPIDTFVEPAIVRMGAVGAEDAELDVHREFQQLASAAEGRQVPVGVVDRFGFYERARAAYLVVATAEARPYGCFLVTKGVI